MNPSLLVVLPEVHEFPFKVLSISEEGHGQGIHGEWFR
jgi:hypothetical protein